ncbi:Protein STRICTOSIDINE SYNTHASE-LIKE 12 [Striga hermonthica]|uniref:Protein STRICTOSIDINE SYNTHASE-LIKE 12 n=1 Tax=Striga hermonthica TaxID=68872 RepID=A0A9N7NMB1_STRHE|nr:Protein STRICTOSIDINE SYNTHASE-LIKE 12 [Striga hermonthica]
MFPIFLLLLSCLPNTALSTHLHSFRSLQLPSVGCEAYTFDKNNGGPYTGLNDGRIVKYQGPKTGFVEYATTVSNRSKEMCDGKNIDDPITGPMCGRPIGLEFNHETGELYVVDAFRGLMVVGPGGGRAERVAGGVPFDAPDALAINPVTGEVYFTDIGPIFFKTNNMTEILLSGDKGGRLLKYDPNTKRQTVVLTGLAVPNGVAVSRDGSFVLIAEYIASRIRIFWLKGPNANTSNIFVRLPGNPDNIKRTESGDFWVPVNIQKLLPELICFPLGQRISEFGQILETVNFYAEYNATYITEVQEHLGSLYVASVYTDFVSVYKGLRC